MSTFYQATLEGFDELARAWSLDMDWNRGVELSSFQVEGQPLFLSFSLEGEFGDHLLMKEARWQPNIEKGALIGYLIHESESLHLKARLHMRVVPKGICVGVLFESNKPAWIGWRVRGPFLFNENSPLIAKIKDSNEALFLKEGYISKIEIDSIGSSLIKTDGLKTGFFELLISRCSQ
jgi:hypothetical protein